MGREGGRVPAAVIDGRSDPSFTRRVFAGQAKSYQTAIIDTCTGMIEPWPYM
jgi:hypothetical protein